jgi:hypothetical protein
VKQPVFCTLDAEGFRAQRERYLRVKQGVERVESSPGAVRVTFFPGFDAGVARELVETERTCCSFLDLDLDDSTLTISTRDRERWDVVEGFAKVFA